MKYFFYIILSLTSASLHSQVKDVQDLKKELTRSKDTTRCFVLSKLVQLEFNDSLKIFYNEELKTLTKSLSQNDSHLRKTYLKYLALSCRNTGEQFTSEGEIINALESYNEELKLLEELGDNLGLCGCYHALGNIYYNLGNISKALELYEKGLIISSSIKNTNGIADAYNGIGRVNSKQGDIMLARDCFLKSLELFGKTHNKIGEAATLNNMASVHRDQKNLEKALEYYQKSLALYEEISHPQGIARSLQDIGNICFYKNQNEQALESFHKSLKLMEELGNKQGIASVLFDLGKVYHQENNRLRALMYYEESLKIMEALGNKEGIASALCGIGKVNLEENKISLALSSSLKSFDVSYDIGYPEHIRDAAELLYTIYKRTGDTKKALESYETYIVMRDSIAHEEINKAYLKSQYEKKLATDSIKTSEEKKVAEARLAENISNLKKEKIQKTALYGGLLIVVIFTLFLFNRFRVTQKQKNIISEQKQLVDHKQKEISDSINYAKRIQSAILPSEKEIRASFPESFIYYQPKDIVAGDFYWMEIAKHLVLFAVADSTGHGVPGAMVSVVCGNALNRSVLEFGLTDPAKILDKTRKFVIESFAKGGENVKDGMDISLISLNMETKEIKWAGANNPLWYVHEGKMNEIKADKQPIGKMDHLTPFQTHSIQLVSGDELFLFTDGFADQFGGPNGKKFKYRPLNELLLSLSKLPALEQRAQLDEVFLSWKGDLEQVDDVLIFGFKI